MFITNLITKLVLSSSYTVVGYEPLQNQLNVSINLFNDDDNRSEIDELFIHI